jgi:hypothetical protein
MIRAGRIPQKSTVPLWIRNDGLECQDTLLTFGELAAVLTDLATAADMLAVLETPEGGSGWQ